MKFWKRLLLAPCVAAVVWWVVLTDGEGLSILLDLWKFRDR